MSQNVEEVPPQTFVEAALELGGKSKEEARRTGSLDRADDQVEALFAPRYQTSQSPAHRAVWDRELPLDLFAVEPAAIAPGCAQVMEDSLAVVRRHKAAGTLFDERKKISSQDRKSVV